MPVIRAFRGLRYNLSGVDIGSVVAPPYDVITEERRAELCAADPHNVVRLTLGTHPLHAVPPPSRYEQAATDLARWREDGILVPEPQPALYVYEQEYMLPNDPVAKRRRGVLCLVKLHDYREGKVLPHEGTLPRPKADRLRLMEATRCSFSPIFTIYSDASEAGREAVAGLPCDSPAFEVTDDERVIHRLWVVTDQPAIERLQDALRDQVVIIADGHHRYETALAYREAMRKRRGEIADAPWEYVLMFLCNAETSDVTILPCHRMIRRVEPDVLASMEERAAEVFDTERIPLPPRGDARSAALEELLDAMAERAEREHTFLAYWGADHALRLTIRDKQGALALYGCSDGSHLWELDVALLHRTLIEGLLCLQGTMAESGENVSFTRRPSRAIESVDSGEQAVALFVNATRVAQVVQLASTGEQMPQKGTYFWPKLLTGTVMHDLRA